MRGVCQTLFDINIHLPLSTSIQDMKNSQVLEASLGHQYHRTDECVISLSDSGFIQLPKTMCSVLYRKWTEFSKLFFCNSSGLHIYGRPLLFSIFPKATAPASKIRRPKDRLYRVGSSCLFQFRQVCFNLDEQFKKILFRMYL